MVRVAFFFWWCELELDYILINARKGCVLPFFYATSICVRVRVRVRVYVYLYIYMCVCVCMCIFIYICIYMNLRDTSTWVIHGDLQCVAVCCSVLQCVAVCHTYESRHTARLQGVRHWIYWVGRPIIAWMTYERVTSHIQMSHVTRMSHVTQLDRGARGIEDVERGDPLSISCGSQHGLAGIYIFMYVCVCVCLCICVYVHMCVYKCDPLSVSCRSQHGFPGICSCMCAHVFVDVCVYECDPLCVSCRSQNGLPGTHSFVFMYM